MKIAVPTTGNDMVDSHFGHCEYFTVFTIEDNKIAHRQVVPSAEGCGCKSDIASVLNQMGVSIMLAGNMGPGAVNVLNNNGIDVYRGCQGNITNLVEEFINGQVDDSGETCGHHAHHEHSQGCSHN